MLQAITHLTYKRILHFSSAILFIVGMTQGCGDESIDAAAHTHTGTEMRAAKAKPTPGSSRSCAKTKVKPGHPQKAGWSSNLEQHTVDNIYSSRFGDAPDPAADYKKFAVKNPGQAVNISGMKAFLKQYGADPVLIKLFEKHVPNWIGSHVHKLEDFIKQQEGISSTSIKEIPGWKNDPVYWICGSCGWALGSCGGLCAGGDCNGEGAANGKYWIGIRISLK